MTAVVGQLSEYELLRKDNIKRNEEFLQSLGLAAVKPPSSTSSSATKKEQAKKSKRKSSSEDADEEVDPEDDGYFHEEIRGSKKSKLVVEPARRSLRNQQQPPQFEFVELNENNDLVARPKQIARREIDINIDEDLEEGRNVITAPQIREIIQATNPDHDEMISNDAITHCAYRMSYMSNQNLGTRLKAIARAAGKHSHEKLLVFYYCLRAANLPALAASAEEALVDLGAVIDN